MRASIMGIILLIALIQPTAAQSPDQTLSRFRAFRFSGQMVECQSGRLTATAVEGLMATGQRIQIPRSDITKIEIASGSKGAKYAILGALTGAGTAGLAILTVEADPNRELLTDRVGPMVAGLTIGGAAIGFLIGATRSNWQTLPLPSVDPVGGRFSLTFRIPL